MAALRIPAIVAAALLWIAAAARADGILSRLRGEVNEPDHGDSSDSGGTSNAGRGSFGSTADDDDDSNPFADLASWVVIGVVTSPIMVPIAILDDHYDRVPDFPNAPYNAHSDGYLRITAPTDVSRNWAGRASFDTGSNLDDLYSLNGRLQLEHQNRWGLDASWSHLNEHAGGVWDDLTLGDTNLVFRFAQGEAAQFYSGIGFNWLTDHGDFDAGINFTYGLEWFPVDPLVVSSSIDLGSLGGATLFRSRTTLGAMIERVEVYGGFDYLNIEGIDIPTGIAGLRIWF